MHRFVLSRSLESAADLAITFRIQMAESKLQRPNRELIGLLYELRVVLPGVQVLFAFLLSIPFARGFPKLRSFERDVYLAALLATVLSTILLITPSAYHRIVFRHHDTQDLLEISNKLTLAGTAALAIAMVCSLSVNVDSAADAQPQTRPS